MKTKLFRLMFTILLILAHFQNELKLGKEFVFLSRISDQNKNETKIKTIEIKYIGNATQWWTNVMLWTTFNDHYIDYYGYFLFIFEYFMLNCYCSLSLLLCFFCLFVFSSLFYSMFDTCVETDYKHWLSDDDRTNGWS